MTPEQLKVVLNGAVIYAQEAVNANDISATDYQVVLNCIEAVRVACEALPAILEALKVIVTLHHDEVCSIQMLGQPERCICHVAEAREAIAKAEGSIL
ncbi:hypothetical protein LCGC14_1092110 [marine sediment metagenome]|uniref:Uncharacterized protein n=1 Tax=marine sediment metagenome TaxID=412755 RepID=A0A0F9MZU0_9ZZZZ